MQCHCYGWSDHLAQLGAIYAHLVCVLVSRQNYGRPAVVAPSPGHSQIFSRSRGSLLCHGPEMVDSVGM